MNPAILPFTTVIACLSLLAAGCNKTHRQTCNESIPFVSDVNDYRGIWELSSTGGGLTGKTVSYAPCNGNRFIFADSTYEQFSNYNLTRQGSYRIISDSSYLLRTRANRLILDNDTQLRQFIRNTGSELHFFYDFPDGGGAMYVRRAAPAE